MRRLSHFLARPSTQIAAALLLLLLISLAACGTAPEPPTVSTTAPTGDELLIVDC